MSGGDPANEMFLIMGGTAEVSKYDRKYKQDYVIHTLNREIFNGET